MRLCDDCIKVLSDDLAQEAIDLLNKVALFNKLSERELVRKLSLNHNHIKRIVHELESKQFLNSQKHGRTNVYLLTENGTRSLKFEEEREMNESRQVGSETEVDDVTVEQEESTQEVKKRKKDQGQEKEKQQIQGQEEYTTDKESKQESVKDEAENLVWDFK